ILETHPANCTCGRSDKDEARLRTGFGKIGILGEKTVARVDTVRAGLFCRRNQMFDREIAGMRLRPANQTGLIARASVQRASIGFRINRDCMQAEALGRARNATGNFAAISDEDGAQHLAASERVMAARSTHCASGAPLALACGGEDWDVGEGWG